MAKIVAIGGGRYSDGEIEGILEYIYNLSQKNNPVITILPTASFDNMDEDTPPYGFFKELGGKMNILKVSDSSLSDDDIRKTILTSDIIYVLGGNLERLMREWKKHGVDSVMREAFDKDIVLSGYSSGSMCWFKRGYDDCGENNEFMFVDCIGLLPYCNCVHYESDDWQSFTSAVKEQDLSSVALDDGAALVFSDGTYSLLFGKDEESRAYFINAKDGYSKTELKSDFKGKQF